MDGIEYHLIVPKSKIKIPKEVYIWIETHKERMMHKEKRELRSLVLYGLKKDASHGPEATALLKLYHIGAIDQPSKEKIKFSTQEIHKLSELEIHPSRPVKEKNGRYYLTENGVDMVEGIIIALKSLEWEVNET